MPSYLELDPGEEIVFVRHRHIINLIPIAISTILVALALLYISGWLAVNADKVPAGIPISLVNMGLAILGILAAATFLAAIIVFLQNKIILTNRHYMQIDQFGLFNRSVNKLRLDEIQDVRGTRKGFFATLLSYGEILIETAGNEPNFLFKPVGDPLNVAEAINDCRHQYRKG